MHITLVYPMIRSTALVVFLALCCFLALCGCNRSPGLPVTQTLPVTGKVTLDGNPLAGADVVFALGDPPVTFFATTKDDGTYQLQGMEGRKAELKGACKVTISRMVMPDGSPWLKDQPPALVGAIEQLPAKYSMLNSTVLNADVKPEGGTFDFALVSK